MLVTTLRELALRGAVERREAWPFAYGLTPAGHRLLERLPALEGWDEQG